MKNGTRVLVALSDTGRPGLHLTSAVMTPRGPVCPETLRLLDGVVIDVDETYRPPSPRHVRPGDGNVVRLGGE